MKGKPAAMIALYDLRRFGMVVETTEKLVSELAESRGFLQHFTST